MPGRGPAVEKHCLKGLLIFDFTLLYFTSLDFINESMNDSGFIYLLFFNDFISQNLERQSLGRLIKDELDKNCCGLSQCNVPELCWLDLRVPRGLHA